MLQRYLLALLVVFLSHNSWAYFIDGDGHYALRPESQTNPGFSKNRGLHSGTFQSFRLLGEARANDKLSMNLEFRLFDDMRNAYLGDTAEPEDCAPLQDTESTDGRQENSGRGNSSDCQGRHQDTGNPGYAGYSPKVTELYAQYAFDYCLLDAGRRSREWGMGIFMDAGKDPFDTSYSVYDGITCAVNIQKTQALGFSVGADKLAETGASIDIGLPSDDENFGPSKESDDLQQLFFTIEYNDRKANAGSSFTRQVGIYVANVFGTERLLINEDSDDRNDRRRKAKTDIKFADLYTGFYFPNFIIRNELLLRLGKSADPAWARYGGVSSEKSNRVVKNDVNSIGAAGDIRWIMSRSGAAIGPQEYSQGNASSHSLFFDYAYAPGARRGYSPEYECVDDGDVTCASRKISAARSGKKAPAMAFHRNYKPAMIMFNGQRQIDDMRVDGIFDPSRVMNAIVFGLGYDYLSNQNGNFQMKFITASLEKGIPKKVKDEHFAYEEERDTCEDEDQREICTEPRKPRPVGYSGTHLGYELDLKYSKQVGKDLNLGIGAAAAMPGAAWRTSKEAPEFSYLLQAHTSFFF